MGEGKELSRQRTQIYTSRKWGTSRKWAYFLEVVWRGPAARKWGSGGGWRTWASAH